MMIQHSRPHLDKVKQIVMDEKVLITASEDQTIFIYTISQSPNGTLLTPVGFIPFSVQQIALIEFDENKVKNENKAKLL